jgi:hypothetical protein
MDPLLPRAQEYAVPADDAVPTPKAQPDIPSGGRLAGACSGLKHLHHSGTL